jgi:hypothetical protein
VKSADPHVPVPRHLEATSTDDLSPAETRASSIGHSGKTTPIIHSRSFTPPLINSRSFTPPLINSRSYTPPLINSRSFTPPLINSRSFTPPLINPRSFTPPLIKSGDSSATNLSPLSGSKEERQSNTTPVVKKRPVVKEQLAVKEQAAVKEQLAVKERSAAKKSAKTSSVNTKARYSKDLVEEIAANLFFIL